MNFSLKSLIVLFAITSVFIFSGCDVERPVPQNQVSDSGAEQVDPIKVKKRGDGQTHEQWAINERIARTSDPTKVLWMHVIALDGSIINRSPVKCKVTSSGKSVLPKHVSPATTAVYESSLFQLIINDETYYTNEIMGPDGTFGSSDPYVYWFDAMDRYHQLGTAGGLGYLLTDYPIDLENPKDRVTGLYNMQNAAFEWQQQQELKLSAEMAELQKKFDALKKREAAAKPKTQSQ